MTSKNLIISTIFYDESVIVESASLHCVLKSVLAQLLEKLFFLVDKLPKKFKS